MHFCVCVCVVVLVGLFLSLRTIKSSNKIAFALHNILWLENSFIIKATKNVRRKLLILAGHKEKLNKKVRKNIIIAFYCFGLFGRSDRLFGFLAFINQNLTN